MAKKKKKNSLQDKAQEFVDKWIVKDELTQERMIEDMR